MGQVGHFLQKQGYRIKVFNSVDFAKSMHYNPIAYLKTESDILKFINALITNTKGDGKEGDEFWTKAETLLYCALVAYIVFEGKPEDKNINTLVDMINSMETREDDENFKNAVDYMMAGLEKRKPNHFAVRQYKKYKLASGKTARSILISCGARLAPFDIPQLREIMSYDEMELDRLGDRKTATFFVISDTDTTYNFVVALAFSQMFNLLCERADNVHGGRLPHHVRVLWDEAANTGQVPQLEKIVAVIRSREISLTMFLQAQSQLKALYKDHAETIMGNMDSVVFLGGREHTTIKEPFGGFGERDHFHEYGEPDTGPLGELRAEHPAARQGAYDHGRAHHHGRKPLHPPTAGAAAFLFPEVRSEKAPELQVHR